MHPFRAAVEARDLAAARTLLADDVVFRSPVVFKPYQGAETTGAILTAVSQVFEDFVYETEYASADGRDHALVFRARVDDKQVEGCDFLHMNDAGLIDRFTVMVRPLSAAHALRDRMTALIGAHQPDA
jgi:hypothetical protein